MNDRNLNPAYYEALASQRGVDLAAMLVVGQFQGYVEGEPYVSWADRKHMPQPGDMLYIVPQRAARRRSWSILLTSANHGVVGPLGHPFRHAGEHHERVVVVELPAGAGAPSDEVNLVLRAAPTAQDEPNILPDWISYDAVEHTLTIHGTVYSAELFRNLGIAPVGETFTISARENGVLTLLRPAPAAAQAGQVAPIGLSEDRLDRIARNYFSEQWAIQHAKDAIHDALTEAGAAGQVAVPEGWKLVPTHPDQFMINAFITEFERPGGSESGCYRAMLAAAPSAPAEAQQAPADSQDWRAIGPLPVERDEDGSWTHPAIPNFDEDARAYKGWLAAVGLEVTYKMLESEDDSHPVYVSYYENEDPSFAAWEPAPPAGEGWFTFSIHDTEDGPAWVWARRIGAQASTSGERPEQQS